MLKTREGGRSSGISSTERYGKEENLEMKGIEKKGMWVVGGTGKEGKKDREGEKERIPPGSEPVQLNNGSA